MNSPESQGISHPLARANLPILKSLQAEGQTVGTRGHHMQITGLFHWGFLIYRCGYSNDDLFNRFIVYLHEQAEGYHHRQKQDRTTALYLRWTVIQDRETLEGAIKDQVRERFVKWRDGLSVARDGDGADHRVTPFLPRFEYCIHVGKGSLDSLRAHEETLSSSSSAAASGQQESISSSSSSPVFLALVRAEQKLEGLPEGYDLDRDDEDDDEDLSNVLPAVEGSTTHDGGWMYVNAEDWVTLYEKLHDDQA